MLECLITKLCKRKDRSFSSFSSFPRLLRKLVRRFVKPLLAVDEQLSAHQRERRLFAWHERQTPPSPLRETLLIIGQKEAKYPNNRALIHKVQLQP